MTELELIRRILLGENLIELEKELDQEEADGRR